MHSLSTEMRHFKNVSLPIFFTQRLLTLEDRSPNKLWSEIGSPR